MAELEKRLQDLTARVESVHRLGPAVPRRPDSEAYAAVSEDPQPRTSSGSHIGVPTFTRSPWDFPLEHMFPKGSIFEVQPEHPLQLTANGKVGSPAEAISPSPPVLTSTTSTATTGSLSSSPCHQSSSQSRRGYEKRLWPQGGEAEAMLGEYKTYMGHLFPFAVVPPHMSSAQLRQHKPFFWKAIMMKACLFDGARQVSLGNELLKEIPEAAFMKPQKNLDLLQGLQLLISWLVFPWALG